jgi:hypothetical protein
MDVYGNRAFWRYGERRRQIETTSFDLFAVPMHRHWGSRIPLHLFFESDVLEAFFYLKK